MPTVTSSEKRARVHHRQQLRTLTYVTLDEGNGGIVRNLNHAGIAVQTVAPLRLGQRVRVRFELRQPRLPVEARGEVSWAHSSGQSGIRFLDLPPKKVRQVNEWIFANLLECVPVHALRSGGLFEVASANADAREISGLLVSPAPNRVIPLDNAVAIGPAKAGEAAMARAFDLDWLSRPLSGTALALAIDTLVVFAAMLLFFLVFFSVSTELPEWPMNVGLAAATAIFVVAFYWGFFHTMAGTTLGASLARLTESAFEEKDSGEKSARFR
jgi:hypothetical protein